MSKCCTAVKKNTAGNKCPELMDVAKRLIFVPEFGSDGLKNEFANEAAVTFAAIEAKLNNVNTLDRIYPLEIIENVEDLRAETVFFEFSSGRRARVRDGVRTATAYIPYQGPEYLAKIKAWGCSAFGIYIADKSDNLIYITDKSTGLKVRPIMIDNNTFDAQLVKKTESDPLMIMITFDYRQSQADELLRYIEASELDFSPVEDIYGLFDVTATYSAISTTGFTAALKVDYGFPVTGLVAGDFALYNVTTAAAVAIVTAVEVVPGSYAFTFTAQTAGNVIIPTPTKNRFDFSAVVANPVTIPL
jgi:hypothetical protein